MSSDFPRLIYALLVLLLVLPGAWHLARRSRLPVLPAILAWLALGGALMLAHGWWTGRHGDAPDGDVTGPAVISDPAPGSLRL